MRYTAFELHPDSVTDLCSAVESVLARSSCLAGKSLRFEVHEDGVVLRGFVRSYYHKQLVQESLKSITNLPRIHNRIEVIS